MFFISIAKHHVL